MNKINILANFISFFKFHFQSPHLTILWVDPGRQLSTTQALTHSPAARERTESEGEK